ncbi:hypothetical protein [Ekhidna sp.]|jgi:hypothetical protein|uniref:hypothetical protein n=1 Tax=Ekhidna sp. TaxID=2608089 RepID=UPI0032EEE14F
MGSFFQSKFIKDLEQGELPEVTIEIKPQSIFNLAVSAFFVSIAVVLSVAIIKHIANQ